MGVAERGRQLPGGGLQGSGTSSCLCHLPGAWACTRMHSIRLHDSQGSVIPGARSLQVPAHGPSRPTERVLQ